MATLLYLPAALAHLDLGMVGAWQVRWSRLGAVLTIGMLLTMLVAVLPWS